MQSIFRQEVTERTSTGLEGTISLISPLYFRTLTVLILVILVVTAIFLSIGSYTKREKVLGHILPDTGLIKMSAQRTGIITHVLVQEGKKVKQGQPLLRLTSEKFGRDGKELNQAIINQYVRDKNNIIIQSTKQKKQHALELAKMEKTLASLKEQLAQLEIQSNYLVERISINKNIIVQLTTLGSEGYISDLELKRQSDTLLSLKNQESLIDFNKLSFINQIQELENEIKQLPIDHERSINALDSRIGEISIQLETIKYEKVSELRAPIDGIVSGVLVKTGQKVFVNDSVLSLLPEKSNLQAILYVPTAAFGFVEKGQYARLRYHAFAYEKFGLHEGVIVEVSSNVILPSELDNPNLISEPCYRVIVRLNSNSVEAYGRSVKLKAGMMLDADIILETRSLLRWLFDPIFSIKG